MSGAEGGPLAIVAVVNLLILVLYMMITMRVGQERGRRGIEAPSVAGDPTFERAYRVQVNTLEQMVITLPAMWICAWFFRTDIAAGLGLAFILGRILYQWGYMREPSQRIPGMVVGFLANVGLVACGLWGAIGACCTRCSGW